MQLSLKYLYFHGEKNIADNGAFKNDKVRKRQVFFYICKTYSNQRA